MKFSSIDSSTSYYGPVSTMTTTFFENSKINFTILQIKQLNYNCLSMDLSTSAHGGNNGNYERQWISAE